MIIRTVDRPVHLHEQAAVYPAFHPLKNPDPGIDVMVLFVDKCIQDHGKHTEPGSVDNQIISNKFKRLRC